MHNISWTNEWNVTKLARVYHWDKLKSWLEFGDLYLISKVTGRIKYVKNSLKLIHFLNLLLDSHQTNTDIPLGQSYELTVFFGDRPIFKVKKQLRKVECLLNLRYFLDKWTDMYQSSRGPRPNFQGHSLVWAIYIEQINIFSPNLHRCTIRMRLRADYISVNLTLFSRSQEDLNMYKLTKIDDMFWANGLICIRRELIYHCDRFKTCLGFDDLDPFSRS